MRLKGLAGSSTDDLVKCVVLFRKKCMKSAGENRAHAVFPARCARKTRGEIIKISPRFFSVPAFDQLFMMLFSYVIQHETMSVEEAFRHY